MTPLRLELSGFTCFRETTAVSFEDLGLFAISGPTGSGKSTLLDAVTYVLYGQTARLGGKGLEVLMSPGLSQMFVTFEFKNAVGTYKVTRLSERKGKAGRLENQVRIERLAEDASWKQLPESEKIREAGQKLEQIIGLDYDGFTRAVLLPQGAFDEFLRGDASKRRKLLVNLLGLDKIEAMQKEAGRRAREAEARQHYIRERLEQDFEGATPERLGELKEEQTALTAKQRELEQAREQVTEELKGLDDVKGLLEEQAKVEMQRKALNAKQEEMQRERERLAKAKQAALIAPQLRQLDTLGERAEKTREECQQLGEKLEAHKAQAGQSNKVLEELDAKAEARLPEITDQLEALAEVRPWLSQLSSRGGSLALAEKASAEVSYSDEAWDTVQAQRSKLPTVERAQRDVHEGEEAVKAATHAVREAEREVKELSQKLEALTQEGKVAREAASQAERAYRQALTEHQALDIRRHLHEGDACPVCQQVVKALPNVEVEADVAALEQSKYQADERLNEAKSNYRATKTHLEEGAKKRLEERKIEQQKAEQQLDARRKTLAEAMKAFEPFGTTDLKEITQQLEARREALLASLAAQIRERAGGRDPEKAHAQLTRERKELEQQLKSAQEAMQRAASKLDKLSTQWEMLVKRREELEQELQASRREVDEALKGADFEDAQAVRTAALTATQLENLEAKLKQHDTQRDWAERRSVELQAKLAGRTLDQENYDALKEQQVQVAEELAQVQQRLGSVSTQLKHVQEQLERAKGLREELQTLADRYDTYRQLSLDLRSNEFQDFLMTRVQQDLAVRASTIIREVTDGRYDLRLYDGDYHVLDAWHTGEMRSAKTLSGGETFIASLSLALALSETIAGNVSLGALFLDEGFGTLDAETLDAVAAVLEALSEQGRMVGIITHVAALSERMPARLQVHKGPDGSTVMWDA